MDARLTVRAAMPSDAQGIAEVHVKAWVEAYSHLVPAEALASQNVEQRARRWVEIIETRSAVFVALDSGLGADAVVGFASSSPGHIDGPRNLELEALYILASHYGTGIGQALMDAAVVSESAYLWVADDNPRARTFYARNGFVADGATDTHSLAGTPVAAIRMVR